MKVLIFHTGSLGDTLVAIPAFWAVREHFNNARITLMCDQQVGKALVQAQEVLEGSGLVDDVFLYPAGDKAPGFLGRRGVFLNFWKEIRRMRFDALIYLIRNGRPRTSIIRDILFFRSAGIRKLIGHQGFIPLPRKNGSDPLPLIPHQTDQVLSRLALSGIQVPGPGKGRMDLRISTRERERVDILFRNFPDPAKNPWIAIGPGSKMPAKRWPLDRYETVVEKLIKGRDVWPIVFGETENRLVGEKLVGKWGRGYVVAGALNVRYGIAALERCLFYLGNDTGTMHMAVAAGIPCIAIFSSRDYPGNWYPYGNGHNVFRTPIDCEGCKLERCIEREMKCILSIDVDQVYAAAEKMLERFQ